MWAENLAAFEAFLAVATQWRVVGHMNGMTATGLDYAGARAGLDLAGIAVTPALWADLQSIEHGAIAAMNEAQQ
ncbi:MAG: DUF1799 domain-containing protein [Rhodobacteraceae bacterium]|nr:DUF1799 domain-containing protein [Paracoccaceae bacterium]